MREEIIISGFGGQGIFFAGLLLCNAAMKEGKPATFFPSYGAEIRGGVVNCQIIISDNAIGAPIVYNPDVLISLNEQSYRKFSGLVKKGGIILANTSLYKPEKPEAVSVFEVAANQLAEKCGSSLFVNMAMLGALISARKIVSPQSITDSIKEAFARKKDLCQPNIRAFETGLFT